MATSQDEFDPPEWMLSLVIDTVVIPTLSKIASEISVTCHGALFVCVRDERIWRAGICGSKTTNDHIDENTEIHLRFRRTHRENRTLFSMDTQHADVWRSTGFSGVWLQGEVVVVDGAAECGVCQKAICYNQGWHDW